MSALATLAVISLLFIALGAVMLLAACDRFMKQAQRDREARFLAENGIVGEAHGDASRSMPFAGTYTRPFGVEYPVSSASEPARPHGDRFSDFNGTLDEFYRAGGMDAALREAQRG